MEAAGSTAPRVWGLTWARLVARSCAIDAVRCPRYGSRMKWVAALTDPASIRTYLTGVGQPVETIRGIAIKGIAAIRAGAMRMDLSVIGLRQDQTCMDG
jgi:hypothetical protein